MKPKSRRAAPKAKRVAQPTGDGWRMEDLPASAQVELRDRLAQAERGEGLQGFDEAMAEGESMAEDILAIVDASKHRPAE